jgi:hypothetical protein
MTRHRHHATVKSSRQHWHQHDSTSTSHHGQVTSVAPLSAWLRAWHLLLWLAIRLRGSPLIRLGGLRSTTPTDSPTRVHFYLTSSTSTYGKRVITTMIWDTSPNQYITTRVGRYDSDCIFWLQSHFLTPFDIMTLVVSPDSGRASRLRSMSRPHVLPHRLWKTSHGRARWHQHLTAWTLSQKQTRMDAWIVQHSKS